MAALLTSAPAVETVEYDDLPQLAGGEQIKVAGRVYTLRAGGCWSFYGEHSTDGVRMTVPVWTAAGKLTTVTIRPTTKVVRVS